MGVKDHVVVFSGHLSSADRSMDELAMILSHEHKGAEHLRGHEGEDGGTSGGDASLGEKDVEVAEGEVDALDGLESAGEAGEDGGMVDVVAEDAGMLEAKAGAPGGGHAASAVAVGVLAAAEVFGIARFRGFGLH